MNTLANMTLAGSAVLLLWLPASRALKNRLPAPWHYRILKLSLLFFLVPVGRLVPVAARMLAALTPGPAAPAAPAGWPATPVAPVTPLPQLTVPSPSPAPSPKSFALTPELLRVLAILWVVGAAAVLLYKGSLYLRLRRRVLAANRPVSRPEAQVVFWSCKRQLGLRGPVALRENPLVPSPLATGLSRPVVVIPATPLSAEDLRYLFLHELTHIKSGDLWIRFASMLALAAHWFNPLAYLLCKQIRAVSEQSCDEQVVCPLSRPERYAYGNVIMKLAANTAAGSGDWTAALSARESIERRLIRVLHTEKLKGGKRLAALALAAAILACGTAAALAVRNPLPVAKRDSAPEAMRSPATGADGPSEAFLAQLREFYAAPEDTPVLFGNRELIKSRGGALLPDDDLDSYQMVDDTIYKEFLTKDGRHMVEYYVGNKEALDHPNLLEELTPDGDYPKNSRGESYGSSAICRYVGYVPDLEFLAECPEENRPAGYVRQTERNSAVPNLPENECPHVFSIPLYDFEGNVIGEYRRECQGHIDHAGLNLSVEDMRAALALGATTNEEALAIVQAGGLENMEAAEAALNALRDETAPKAAEPAPETAATPENVPEPSPEAGGTSAPVPEAVPQASTTYDNPTEATLNKIREAQARIWDDVTPNTPVLFGNKDLITSRGGTLLPDDDPDSYRVRDNGIHKLFIDKNGELQDEYLVGNKNALHPSEAGLLNDLTADGDYRKNSKGESYGHMNLWSYVGYWPDLSYLAEYPYEERPAGYIRESELNSLPDLPKEECPHTFSIPLYDSEGNVIGEYKTGCGGHYDFSGMSVEDAKAAAEQPWE